MEKMIKASGGNIHDIEHLVKVWAYAKTIGELEALDPETLFLLEVEAITHDIACPVCREKYGNTNGKFQEQESPSLIKAFLLIWIWQNRRQTGFPMLSDTIIRMKVLTVGTGRFFLKQIIL
jgi:hypothetical protein